MELLFLQLPPHPLYGPSLHLGSPAWGRKRSLMKLSRRWLRLLGCSSQSPHLITSTSLGILCIKHGNHAPVSTSTRLPGPYSVLGFVLGCEHIETRNKVLAFKELQCIKRDGQTAQVQWRTTVEGYESLVMGEWSDSERCGRGWLRWRMVIVPSVDCALGGLWNAFPYFLSFSLWMVWQQGRVILGLLKIFVLFWNILFWDNYAFICSWKK